MNWKSETGADESTATFELYHENSKQRRHDLSFNRRIYEINQSPDIHRLVSRTFKTYPGAEFLPLSAVEPAEGFERVAALRRSIRRFSGKPIQLDQLGRLLYCSSGMTGRLDDSRHGIVQPIRAAPSGGALYPVELYAAVLTVDGLEQGLYHYAVDRHGLELLRRGDFSDVLSEATSDPASLSNAGVVFILTGVFARSRFKYGERGYRFTLLETGHIAQNILLAATALALGAVAIGGFVDDEVNVLLDLDGVEEAALYLVASGHPAPRPSAEPNELVDRLLVALSGGDSATPE